ncbi:DNA excision repair protein ERCC-6-like [Babylonia areolata]|uniref:DNA excision repair protein ERCC-6-like n=1 Tax=Babylonia areolata TaxID=304850 RepID=UPI003FD104CC
MSESPKPGTSKDSDGDQDEEETGLSNVTKDGLFKVDTDLIPQASLDDQTSELEGLGLSVFNQDEFEQGVMKQVDKAMAKDEAVRLKRILNKELLSISDDMKLVESELEHIRKSESSVQQQNSTPREIQRQLEAIRKQKENKLSHLKTLRVRQKMARIKLQKAEEAENQEINDDEEEDGCATDKLLDGLSGKPKKESKRDRMIRLGLMTPFGTVVKTAHQQQQALLNKQSKGGKKKPVKRTSVHSSIQSSNKRPSAEETNLASGDQKTNRFDEKDFRNYDPEIDYTQKRYQRKRQYKMMHNFSEDTQLSGDEYQEDGECVESDDDYLPDERDMDLEEIEDEPPVKKMKKKQLQRKVNAVYRHSDEEEEESQSKPLKMKRDRSVTRERDDAEESYYMKRLRLQQQKDAREDDDSGEDEEFDGGLVVPGKIWKKLYKYQKTCVRWLWELHCQQAGGIIGDEMGLGKTIQMIAFLAALKTSKIRSSEFRYTGLGPCVIVCPATVMHQWVKEFHTWWPDFRVAILHSSGSFTGSQAELVRSIVRSNGILVTSYSTLVIQQELVLRYDWHYVVLDEGHKIRNPDAQATLCCKQFRTSHRIILSGSPIQNNLKELWSLFDFVFPGKLGTLPDFMAHFSVPIVQGGYANATQVQVETAYKCACVLRDTINPYLLRRMKADVKATLDLPSKSEQVLFCRLTDEQRDIYQEYLDSRECQAILAGKFQVFPGLMTLRKICNHPDISTGGPRVLVGQDISGDPELEYGYWRRSGKLVVVEALLKLWHQQGHRVLLFSQSTAMLDILEGFVQDRQYTYVRMDGTTPISSRQPLVTQFNQTKSIYVFLLTTRVGGLGVNLTGANRIIIYDPDWNPSTDSQARERAWRIGQKRQVTVYRLLTSGTIEEKIYHRQIFKQFLTNRVLKDPKQRRFFKSNDIFELFTLGSKDDNGTETSAIFAGTGSDVHMPRRMAVAPTPTPKALKPNRFDEMKKEKQKAEEEASGDGLESSELERMRELARKLSRQMEEAKRERERSGSASADTTTKVKKTENGSKPLGAESCRKRGESLANGKKSSREKERGKKKRKDAKFEGQRIPNLVKSCDYQQQGGTQGPEDQAVSRQQDDYVLRRLFKKTGIQAVMKHDKIMDSGKADFAIVEAEASKVAKEAVAALRRSRSMCMPAASGVPTWTGHHGGPSVKPRFGQKKNSLLVSTPGEASTKPTEKKPETSTKKSKAGKESMFDGSQAGSVALSEDQQLFSSADLLVRIHKRQSLSTPSTSTAGADSQDSAADAPHSSAQPKDVELLEDIRNFIAFMSDVNGQASTQELLTNFGPRLPKEDSAKFKAMLMQICDFSKVNGAGRWTLKGEFR